MAVIKKERRDALIAELAARCATLFEELTGRDLKDCTEGCKRGSWAYPDMLCFVDSLSLSLAVGDFKTILSELSKIK